MKAIHTTILTPILTILAACFALATLSFGQTAETYDKDAEKLGKIQRAAAMDLSKYENMARKYDEKLADLIGEVVGEMKNVETRLYRPDTGQSTVNTETYIIELIEKAQKECASQCKKCAGAMAGLKPGQNPGPNGNPMLQPSDMAGKAHDGEGKGEAADERGIDAANGLSAAELPEEFRDILESYLNDLEDE